MSRAQSITGLVLAGGLGRRMGRVDKGLQAFRRKPLVAWVIERLQPQVNSIIINANNNLETYRSFGHEVVADQIGGYAGPLAGLHAGLRHSSTPLLVTVPCDSPFLPMDLVARLVAGIQRDNAELAVARTGDQPHPVFALCRCDVLPSLEEFLRRGGRKIDAWYAALRVAQVPFDDEPEGFANINTLEDLSVLTAGENET